MQPPRRKGRPIERPLPPERPLVYETLSDPILVTRARDGDRRALVALCERHAPDVERISRHVLRDPEDALDAAQESLAKLCARLEQFRGEAQFGTWLHRLVVNTCRDVAERQRVRACEPLPEETGGASSSRSPMSGSCDGDPVRAAELASLRLELRAGLREIPPAHARVVVLKDALGLSFEEISAASGMPVGTAKCYAHRGRSRLRARLAERAVA